jgi:ribosomal-protein-alanine N-acetyltransferase
MLPITTSFGSIRRWRESDAAALVRHANNRRVWANMSDGFPFPYTHDHALVFLDLVRGQDPTTYFAVATTEEAIGGIGLGLNTDVYRRSAELGYWLGEPYWGRGIMTEAVTRFSDFARRRFDLVRVYARPYAHNRASARVLEKAGFVREAVMRSAAVKDGQVIDQLLYARTWPPAEPEGR